MGGRAETVTGAVRAGKEWLAGHRGGGAQCGDALASERRLYAPPRLVYLLSRGSSGRPGPGTTKRERGSPCLGGS